MHTEFDAAIAPGERAAFDEIVVENPFGIYIVDADFRLALVSRGARKVFENVEPLLGRDFAEVLRTIWTEPFATETIERFRRTLATGEPYHANGTVQPRADLRVVEAYDWRIERISLPGGRPGVVCYFYDLSERAAHERQLRESEAQLKLALEAARMHTWRADLATGRFLLSPGARRLHDFAAGDAVVTADDVLARIHPQDRERAAAHLALAAQDECHQDLEYRMQASDGSVRWLAITATRLRDSDGCPRNELLGTVWDVTERKATESALTAVYEVSPLLLGVVELLEDGDVRHVYDNPATCRFFGQQPGTTAGKRASELGAPPAVIELWRRQYEAAAATAGPVEFEYVHESGGPGARTLAITVAPLRQYGPGGRPVFCYVGEDVTARRTAEQEIARGAERLQLAIEAAKAGTWDWDLRTGTVVWSPESFALYGLPTRDRPLRFDDFAAAVEATDRPRVLAWVGRILADSSLDVQCEFRVRLPDGSMRWLLSLGRVQRDSAGRALRMHGLHLDITGRKQLEEALQRADRQKDRFLAMLSHELRNPLAPIRTVASILGSPHASDSQIAWSRQVIQRQVRHLSLLLDDLLDVARVTQGKLSLRRSPVPLRGIVDAAIETVQPLLDEKQHRLVLETRGIDERVHVDPLRISQVVSNLLTNAAKYTDPGGRIHLRACVADGELSIEVEDNGVGIPAEALPRMFAMFEQLDGNGDATRGGLGIGLALVKGLVELHGGRVTADSAGPGQGSTFRFRVPLDERDGGTPEARRPEPDAAAPAARKVLVADDNRDAADALAMLVGLGPHEVRVAYGGHEALQLAEEFQPEVAFLDIGMPDVSGHDVARAIRRMPWSRRARLVAITGWGQAEDKRLAHEAGFDRHLTKPVDPGQIESILRGSA